MMKNLSDLCQDLHLSTELEKTDKGYLVPLSEEIQVAVRPIDPGFYITSPISPCPEPKREELFIQLMKANLFGQGTLGATIGYEENENLLTLSARFPYDMDYRAFRERVEDFANIVDYWRGEVALHVKRAQEKIL